MTELPPCPQCRSIYSYADRDGFACPECGHQWDDSVNSVEDKDEKIVTDANGNRLKQGDTVTVIKSLKVKGSSSIIKIGTRVKNIRLVDGDHDIDCKIEGIGAMKLKSGFVKKS